MSIISGIKDIFGSSKKMAAVIPVKKEKPDNPGLTEIYALEESQPHTLSVDSFCREQGHDKEIPSGRKWGIIRRSWGVELTFNGSFVNMHAICPECIEAWRQGKHTDVLYDDSLGFVAVRLFDPTVSRGINRQINDFCFLNDDEAAFQQWAEKLPIEQIAAKKRELLLKECIGRESGSSSIKGFYAQAKAEFTKAKALMAITDEIKYDLSDGGRLIITVEAKDTRQVAEFLRPSGHTEGIAVAFTVPDEEGRRKYDMYYSSTDGNAAKIKEVLLKAEPPPPEGERNWHTYAGYYCADYAIGSPECGSLLPLEEVVRLIKEAI